MAPMHQHETLGLQALLERRGQALDDGVQLVVGFEEERNVEDVERPIDAPEPDNRESRALERAQTDLP